MSVDLKELKRRANAATPGPWHACSDYCNPEGECNDPYCDGIYYQEESVGIGVLYANGDEVQARKNAEYIAIASPDVVLGLLAERDRLRTALGNIIDIETAAFGEGSIVVQEALRALSES